MRYHSNMYSNINEFSSFLSYGLKYFLFSNALVFIRNQ